MLSASEGQTYLSKILFGADEDLFMLGEIMSINTQNWVLKYYNSFCFHKLITMKLMMCFQLTKS